MFGIAKPCRHRLTPELKQQWMGHLCGLCLSLRDGHGQAARVTTNVDAVVLSVLVEAQQVAPVATRQAGACPLRGMRTATVLAPDSPAAQHAVAVSLTMAATKVADHAQDGDGLPGRLPRLSAGLARRWAAAGERSGRATAFDTGVLADAVADAARREGRAGLRFDDYAAPTEEAAAAACRHTAVLAGRPENLEALGEVGRMFGRITYLLDAVEDEADDRAAGRFNALAAAYPDATPAGRRAEGRRLFDDAHRRLRGAFDRLVLPRPDLARVLLVDQLRAVGNAKLGHRRHHDHAPSCRARAVDTLPRGRTVRALAPLAVALGLALPGFRPGGMDPGGISPEELEAQRRRQAADSGYTDSGTGDAGWGDGGGLGSPWADGQQQEQKQHWWDGWCDGCCCDGCCCCCCDDCDCCDC